LSLTSSIAVCFTNSARSFLAVEWIMGQVLETFGVPRIRLRAANDSANGGVVVGQSSTTRSTSWSFKVDRLARSLTDFAGIVELFDKNGVSSSRSLTP
jgi:hypothetical protein